MILTEEMLNRTAGVPDNVFKLNRLIFHKWLLFHCYILSPLDLDLGRLEEIGEEATEANWKKEHGGQEMPLDSGISITQQQRIPHFTATSGISTSALLYYH